MKPVDNVGVTFVNAVVGRGILNNIVNIQFGTFLFNPDENTQKVELDPAVSCRLRMDRLCAQQLYDSLGELLASVAQEEASAEPQPEARPTH